MSKQSKISKVLKTLHKDVLDVQMYGLNSDRMQNSDFVVHKRGMSQVFHGQSKNSISTRNEPHLPKISIDKYSVRTREFLKVNDDPRSGRFLAFNQFPKYLTKANMKQTRVIANFAGGGEKGVALKPKVLYNCHNYDHEVNFNSIRGKRESKGALVPFAKSASFSQTMNYATTRKAH